MSHTLRCVLPVVVLVATSCASTSVTNSSFLLRLEVAEAELDEMRELPRPLARPVVVLGGYLDPGLGSWWLGSQIRELTGDDRVLDVEFFFALSFAECRRRLIAAVDEAFQSDDPDWTVEVDVVGVSMGGLVARLAAAAPEALAIGQRRLRIARLFTISTPHRGASLAELPAVHPLHLGMRQGSTLLERLDDAYLNADYELFPYVRLGDAVVGPSNAAPPGENPWWVSSVALEPSHLASSTDARILADIARRLRGEPAYTREPRAPLPSREPPAAAAS